jgi:hypothetical protein
VRDCPPELVSTRPSATGGRGAPLLQEKEPASTWGTRYEGTESSPAFPFERYAALQLFGMPHANHLSKSVRFSGVSRRGPIGILH